MKKIVLAALVAVASLSANAQVWVGGSLGFNSYDPEVGKSTTTFEIAPTIGYSLDEKWDIALEVGFTTVSYDGNSTDAFRIAPFARYNFAKCGIATFFIDGGFGLGKNEIDNKTDKTAFNIGVRPGVKVELSEKVELDAKLGYLGYYNLSDTYSRIGLSVNGEALSFGVTYKF